MIAENELRIGSLVFNHEGKKSKIVQVGGNTVLLNNLEFWEPEAQWGVHCNELQPIPLTPGILERSGFKGTWYDDFYQVYLEISDSIDVYNGDKNGICEAVFECCGTQFARCKYLHQLQNLFFALTGKELNISF